MKQPLFITALIGAVIILLPGCLTEKNLPWHNEKYPLAAASYFLKKYPVRDSTDTIFTTIKAVNTDYTTLIDSLNGGFDSLYFGVPIVIDTTAKTIILKQQNELSRLKGILSNLRSAYRPCRPDTFKIKETIYRTDGVLKAAYEEVKIKLNAIDKDNVANKGLAKQRLWMFIASCVLNLLLIVLIVAIIKAKNKMKTII